jgi:hypothetical protein
MEYKILISILLFIQSLLISIFIILRINIRILFDKQFIDETHRYSLMKNIFNNEGAFQNYNYNFVIVSRNYNCSNGLFGFYVAYISCMHKYLNNGYIIMPIMDLTSFPNFFNQFNNKSTENDDNPWELFFNQPFEYKLKYVKKYAKKITYINCYPKNRPDTNIYNNKLLLNFWHNIALKYIPIKTEIINESNKYRNNLFKGSNNILGVLIRGTDYISREPKGHPIQPNPKDVIKDVKKMDKSNEYDWIFLTTEDTLIRNQFILSIGKKLKYIKYNENLSYNYTKKEFLAYNNKIIGNINYMKIYLINIIILSKCLDIVCSRTAGSVGAFIFTEGFRNIKVYYLGRYKRKNNKLI